MEAKKMEQGRNIRILGISGSLRKDSYNTSLLRAARQCLEPDLEMSIVVLNDMPIYNWDVEQDGMPETVRKFRDDIARSDAILFASPEYNFSISGTLKNALEWASRPPEPPCSGKPCAIMGASVSPLGTARGQAHLRNICSALNLFPVNSPHCDITEARKKFDDQNTLIDAAAGEQIRDLLAELKKFTMKMA
jgi:chromate reductase